MAKRIDGKAIAAQIKQELKEQVQQLAKDNITVTLAVIQVGQDPASCVYVRNKQRTCEELGIHSLSYELEETTSEEKLLSLIQELNAREDVDGMERKERAAVAADLFRRMAAQRGVELKLRRKPG